MFRTLVIGGMCSLVGGASAVSAADEPRALIERAIRAAGGPDVLRQKAALLVKVKGKMHGSPGPQFTLQGESLLQPGGPARMDLLYEMENGRFKMVVVLDGPRSWRMWDGNILPATEDQVKQSTEATFRHHATGLLPLLEDKGFTLTALPPEKVDGRSAAGVKVAYRGQPDLNLYFDGETALLIKYSYRAMAQGLGKEALHERVFSDCRQVRPGVAAETTLRAAGVAVDDRALLELLRSQVPPKDRVEKARRLIRDLGDDTFAVREKACDGLVDLGSFAIPFLRDAARGTDPEVVRRAKECLAQISEDHGNHLRIAAVRLAAVRRPPGTTAALLDLLGGADESVVREIKAALYAVVQAAGKPDDVLLRALDDRDPVRRGAAAAVLGKDGGAYLAEPRRRLYVRLPMVHRKTRDYVDGNPTFEIDLDEPECFNRFDLKEFSKP